ncbi:MULTISPECIES: GtrA family protein [unclassified Herbaspirillum]|uniref:GtrA family protein n=1 Tax=unclassified Herbaspirillum TaxID=2624150 RepID=UPI00257DA98A|nr:MULTISPECIES: GtrA family protein [unclassified Herbaspirillum]
MSKFNVNSIATACRSENFRQMIRYGLVGLMNVSIEYLVFNLVYYFFKQSTLVANTWSIGITMSFGFLFHHAFTFKNRFYSWGQALRYVLVVTLGAALNYGLLFLLLKVIDQAYLAKLLQIILLSLYNFNMYKHFVYVNKD